jgi:sugar/nucleoside kinase (ribokinase family)
MIIPVIGEDRRFIHTLGANADLRYDDVDLDLIARAKVLYVGGYLVLPEIDQDSLVKILRHAKECGLQTVLDVIVPTGRGERRVATDLAQALPYVDVFLPNDDEGRLLTGEVDPVAQAECFLGYGCPNVVITMGEHGSLAASQEEMLRAPAFRVEVVDPSGAGDAFDAGYILGLLRGWSLRRTLTFASAIGASACTKLGTTPGVFTMPEAEAFLEQNHLPIERIAGS